MIPVRRPEANAGPVIEPQTPPLRLSRRYFQTLLSPQAFDAFMIDSPALPTKQRRDPAVAVAAVLRGQLHHPPDQPWLITGDVPGPTLRGPRLPEHPAGSPL